MYLNHDDHVMGMTNAAARRFFGSRALCPFDVIKAADAFGNLRLAMWTDMHERAYPARKGE